MYCRPASLVEISRSVDGLSYLSIIVLYLHEREAAVRQQEGLFPIATEILKVAYDGRLLSEVAGHVFQHSLMELPTYSSALQ